MATVIVSTSRAFGTFGTDRGESAIARVLSLLPPALAQEIESALAGEKRRSRCVAEEIRLRADRRVYLTLGGPDGKKNLQLSYLLGKDELALIFERMCGGSLYAYGESIIKGFISLGGGVRVGICGRASLEGGRIRGIYDISSLNVRLPCGVFHIECGLLTPIVNSVRMGGGVLIYSPPAQGKTTLLRSLCAALSSGERQMRVAVVDSRDELGIIPHPSEHSIDVLSGYPKPEALSIATAFMNPEVILCDEIGSSDEARAILEAQNCGVPLIATAHGDDLRSLLQRPQIRLLHDASVFSLYIGIRICENGFEYLIRGREEAEVCGEDNRSSADIALCGRSRSDTDGRG